MTNTDELIIKVAKTLAGKFKYDSDDLINEGQKFLLSHTLHTYDEPYVVGALYKYLKKYIYKQKRNPPAEVSSTGITKDYSLSKLIQEETIKRVSQDYLDQLIIKCLLRNLTMDEISRTLGISMGKVHSRIETMREKLL